jgi:nucleoside-diphosphate-sugar epimerase
MDDVDAIVHLSSRTDLRAAEGDPAGDDSMNIEPVRALVRAIGGSKPIQVVFASTVTIVGPNPELPVGETAPDRPCSVYDRHKLACEKILREATAAGVLRACSLRLSNVYGFGIASKNSNRGIVNAMIRKASEGQPLSMYGDGSYLRDFTHLADVVDAFYRASMSSSACDGTAYVIATGKGHTLAQAFSMIAEEAQSRTGRAVDLHSVPEPADLHEIERRNFIGNPALFGSRTGWRPRVKLRSGICDYFDRIL